MLVLASSSPRRAELLRAAGVAFEIEPAAVDETPRPDERPDRYVRRVATEKACAVAARRRGALVLAADTVVVLGRRMLGKPRDAGEATRMLRALSGRSHRVVTGVALIDQSGRRASGSDETRVEFAPLSHGQIARYVASGEPLDKAGAYALQGRGALFIRAIHGSPSNVVGLPLACVYRLCRRLGVDLLAVGEAER